MKSIFLHDNWTLRCSKDTEILPAKVPGSVYNDLLANKKMEDPYYRDNELKALALMDQDFTYETTFDVPQDILEMEEVILHFDGIDTVADVYLNGKHLGYCENMHRTWEYSVKKNLKPDKNELKVELHSPTKFVQEAYEKAPIEGSSDAMRGFPRLRKAHYMFGWDWGPRLPDAGIWRSVKLLGITRARIDSVYITQKHEAEAAELKLQVDILRANKKKPTHWNKKNSKNKKVGEYEYRVTVTYPDGSINIFEDSPSSVRILNPQLWWPNGYGGQPLYTVKVDLLCEGELLDTWERRIGLRTMTVSRQKDQWGEEFAHMVNGVKIFAMGADYIPEDNILARCNPERTYELLKQAKAANHNCVRVWGGGYYPEDWFYDACDELGLMVWQDFMFACAVYELTPEFEANVVAEFIDNIKRIRHHASLGLWCGNNENESFVKSEEWVTHISQKAQYVMLHEYIMPKVLKEYDPNTFYWPSSPSSGGSFDDPQDENRGDVHYWDVWHGNKPITEYRKFFFRYLSEFGFQSFPSLPTCESFTEPEDRNIFSYVMEKHQRNSSANGKIMNYLEQTFLYPTSFDTLLYASQLLQAEAIRYGVEHFRRNRGRCMGSVVWQLNDCWPVASWASIDYFGRWKALHYYEKRFFAPLLLSCEEESVLTQDTNPNAQPYDVKKSIRLNLSNESMKERKVTVRWELRDASAAVLRSGREDVSVPALSAVWLEKTELPEAELYSNYVSYHLEEKGQTVSGGSVIFTTPKYFRYQDPKLQLKVEGDEIVVSAEAYARSIEIHNSDDTLLLEDNYFDMDAGERRVRILSGNTEGLKARSVYDIR